MSLGFRIKSRKVIRCVGWWLVVHLEYSVSFGPFLTMNFKFDQDHGSRPGLELDTIYITFQMTCQLEFHVNIISLIRFVRWKKVITVHSLNGKGWKGWWWCIWIIASDLVLFEFEIGDWRFVIDHSVFKLLETISPKPILASLMVLACPRSLLLTSVLCRLLILKISITMTKSF